MRRYKSGSRWAVWRCMDIIINGELYLRRLHVWHTPWGGVMLHRILRPDAQRHLHDHPVNFWSFILRGWYFEERKEKRVDGTVKECVALYSSFFRHGPKWGLNKMKATPSVSHRIVATDPRTVTLVIYGPRLRVWGFHTENGWVPWREYEDPAIVTSREVLP